MVYHLESFHTDLSQLILFAPIDDDDDWGDLSLVIFVVLFCFVLLDEDDYTMVIWVNHCKLSIEGQI